MDWRNYLREIAVAQYHERKAERVFYGKLKHDRPDWPEALVALDAARGRVFEVLGGIYEWR